MPRSLWFVAWAVWPAERIDLPESGYRALGEIGEIRAMFAGIYELATPPSIAILAFTNMSGDPKQEYFSDGIPEDIITSLSKTGSSSPGNVPRTTDSRH